MKKFFVGILLCLGLVLVCAESASDDVLASIAIKVTGLFSLFFSGLLFRRWKIAEDGWVRRFLDD